MPYIPGTHDMTITLRTCKFDYLAHSNKCDHMYMSGKLGILCFRHIIEIARTMYVIVRGQVQNV